MPAKKPSTLTTRHDTKADRDARESAENAMTPKTQLPTKPPPLLQKHPQARGIWTQLVGLYSEVQGKIVTAFDEHLLAKYCLLEEECVWLEGKRAAVDKQIVRIDKLLANKEKAKQLDSDQYISLLQQYNALNARVQGLDARLDGKRKLVHALAQSLYLTPRSRAGVAPPEKPPEEPKDDMEKLLTE